MSTEGSCQFSSVPPSCRGSLIKQGSVPPSCRAVSVRGRIGSVRTKPGAAGTTTLMLPVSQPPYLESGHLPSTKTICNWYLVQICTWICILLRSFLVLDAERACATTPAVLLSRPALHCQCPPLYPFLCPPVSTGPPLQCPPLCPFLCPLSSPLPGHIHCVCKPCPAMF